MNDNAGMMIMGDWAKGELMAWGASPVRKDFGCAVVPGTEGMHLYSVDTLAMLVSARQREATQEKMAEVVVSRHSCPAGLQPHQGCGTGAP